MRTPILTPALLLAAAASTAVAAPPTVLVSTINGHPTAAIPGLPGEFDFFNLLHGSPRGTRFIMKTVTDLDTEANDVLIGGLLTPGGATIEVLGQEGQPATFAPDPLETLGLFDNVASILDDGRFAYGNNTKNGSTASDEYIVLVDGSGPVSIAREDDPVPALPGATYGCCSRGVNLLPDGRIGFQAQDLRTIGGIPDVLIFDGQLLAQSEATVPSGQFDGGIAVWSIFDIDRFWIDADGESWIIAGTLSNAARVIAVNNTIRVQSGFAIPGSFLAPVAAVHQARMEHNGDWFGRGTTTDGNAWVVRNGAAIAATSAPIIPGSSENWQQVGVNGFDFHISDEAGNVLIGGNTDNPDTGRDDVVVLNGETVVLRSGDAVDLDGDGTTDDAFVDTFEDDSAFVSADGHLILVAFVRNGAGTRIGETILRVDLPLAPQCPADWDQSGGIDGDDITAFFNDWQAGEADIDGSGGTDGDDITFFFVRWQAGC